jgi:hypothetical protein
MTKVYKNVHGHEPSPPASPEYGHPTAAELAADAAFSRKTGRKVQRHQPIVARVGREGIDETQCQAPVKVIGPHHERARCDRPATCVVVENQPRSDGVIAAMSLCTVCWDGMRLSRPGYAHMTPITPAEDLANKADDPQQ